MFQSIYSTIVKNIQNSFKKGSGCIIYSVIAHTGSISKYNTLAGSIYTKLPKELDHPRKGFVNIQNIDDNEFLKWCLIRYLNPADHHAARITKADEDLQRDLTLKA